MSANASTLHPTTHRSPFGRHGPGRGRWNAPNAIATVASLILLGPFGLLVLGWVVSGRDVRDLPGAARRLWASLFGGRGGDADLGDAAFGAGRTGNAVFDDYQRTQHERIREIREEMRTRARRFAEFRAEARRRADREEFDRFMASAPAGDADAA